MDASGTSFTLFYWIDRQGRPQVYDDRLAAARAVQWIDLHLSRLNTFLLQVSQISDPSHISWIKTQAEPLVEENLVADFYRRFFLARDVTLGDIAAGNIQDMTFYEGKDWVASHGEDEFKSSRYRIPPSDRQRPSESCRLRLARAS